MAPTRVLSGQPEVRRYSAAETQARARDRDRDRDMALAWELETAALAAWATSIEGARAFKLMLESDYARAF
jgi:hypothetical protein